MQTLFLIIVLVLSAIFHEYMHAWVADRLGDTTAKDQGRLTLNPIPHIDPIGSILVPLLTVLGAGFVFAWAKPVPFNPYNLRDQKYGSAKVAAAGPLSNLFLAVVFGFIMRLFDAGSVMFSFLSIIVYINLILAVFNLIPIPPLDGSRILTVFLSPKWKLHMYKLEKYGMILILVFIFFLYPVITPIINWLFRVVT